MLCCNFDNWEQIYQSTELKWKNLKIGINRSSLFQIIIMQIRIVVVCFLISVFKSMILNDIQWKLTVDIYKVLIGLTYWLEKMWTIIIPLYHLCKNDLKKTLQRGKRLEEKEHCLTPVGIAARTWKWVHYYIDFKTILTCLYSLV